MIELDVPVFYYNLIEKKYYKNIHWTVLIGIQGSGIDPSMLIIFFRFSWKSGQSLHSGKLQILRLLGKMQMFKNGQLFK